MMPLSSWLECHWRHNESARNRQGYATVVKAARKLDQSIWDKHKIKLLYCPDPWRFRDISTEEVKRAQRADMSLGDADFPQLGTHADPTCRHLTADNFYSLIGTRTDRPLPLITMNTAALYEGEEETTLLRLFKSRRLWSDHPERDCADLSVSCDDVNGFMFSKLPAVFLGTAWVRQDRRRQGIMTDVSQLHRMVAWLRYGPIPQFATIAPDRNHDRLFDGTDIGCVIETRPTHTTTSRVLYYSPEAILAAAKRVLSSDNVNRTHA